MGNVPLPGPFGLHADCIHGTQVHAELTAITRVRIHDVVSGDRVEAAFLPANVALRAQILVDYRFAAALEVLAKCNNLSSFDFPGSGGLFLLF